MIQVISLLVFFMVYNDLVISSKEGYEVYTIISSRSKPCNKTEQCLTLSRFASNYSLTNHHDYVSTNTTVVLYFQQGVHHLDSTNTIRNINTFFMSSLSGGDATIVCNDSSARFEFYNASVVTISGLTFFNCTGNEAINVGQFTLEDSLFLGHKDIIGTALKIAETSAKLIRSTFRHNHGNTMTYVNCYPHLFTHYGAVMVHVTAGGAIATANSSITVINSLFEGNSAQAGGAIFTEQMSNITIINSTFVKNRARSNPLQSLKYCDVGGGVLYGDGCNSIVVQDSIFEHNEAEWFGGIIATSHHDNVTVIIANSRLKSNNARFGGVLFCSGEYLNITLFQSEFTSNEAYSEGGVIHLDHANHLNLTITNNEFTSNSASNGGVIHVDDSDHLSLTITSNEFTSNSASNGGVIHIDDANHLNLTITNNEFTSNNAFKYSGGVMYLFNVDHTNLTINDCKFTNNRGTYGGVLNQQDSDNAESNIVNITESKFTNNRAIDGGVLSLYASKSVVLVINDSKFTSNIATINGGVMDVHGSYNPNSTITITDSQFTNNVARREGGVMIVYLTFRSTITIIGSDFTGNRAYSRTGGVLSAEFNDFVTIISNNCNMTSNRARLGGVAYVFSSTRNTLVIAASRLVHNTASKEGGVLSAGRVDLKVSESTFMDNKAVYKGGTMNVVIGTINISQSKFHHNVANFGGVLSGYLISLNSHGMKSNQNFAHTDGGVLYILSSTAVMTRANFSHNTADNNGGIMYTSRSMTYVDKCTFSHNKAGNDGGVTLSHFGEMTISKSEYVDNSADNEGGVFNTDQTSLTINQTSFTRSKARDGGVIWTDQGTVAVNRCHFADNNASLGGMIWAEQATIKADRVNITRNYATVGAVYLLDSDSDWSDISYLDNIGSLYAFGGSHSIRKNSKFVNNTQSYYSPSLIKEGGTVTVIESEIKFYGNLSLTKGHATNGGALQAIRSEVYVYGSVTIANNTATEAGGGIYLYHCKLTCQDRCNLRLQNNTARENGGGISAISSVIKLRASEPTSSRLQFNSNQAMNGGGLFLEMDSKVYILKSKGSTSKSARDNQRLISFSFNTAQYGGAVYVSDNGMCSISTNSIVYKCFIQTLAMYAPMPADSDTDDDTRCQNINFAENTAELSGNSLFGGLLDRCSISQFAEININENSNETMIVKGYEYFKKITNIQDADVGSHPMKICFCTNGQPDCSHNKDPIKIRKMKNGDLLLSLAVVNQINNPLHDVKIYSHFHPNKYICQNHVQHIHGSCKNVGFRAFSYNDTEELVLSFQEGPCKDAPESEARVTIEFVCPLCSVGFELKETRTGCQCVCDSKLLPYFTNCLNNTLIRDKNVWITNLTTNHTNNVHQYLIHPHCPFDYCHPPSSRVGINLNILNGADVQCASNRAGLLCGVCQHNFSLSLGSSQCLRCSTHQLAILIAILMAAILAGIILVALLLVLNLTVAIGTLNGIIFYANIVYASSSVFFLSADHTGNFIYTLISWLNLEIGIETCFFVGMDAYSKTLLQLAFPGYVFFLVFLIIIISKYSMKFSQLIGKRNPVATLATLISLSYAKFLQINVASLSFAILKYPNGSRDYVWLVDASVSYLRGKHVVLFIISLTIIVAGLGFTVLLLFWQWLLRHQDKAMCRWTKYQKLCHIIEPFHAPFVDKHRYWAGLLFLVRVVLYIVFALNVNGDPRVCFMAIILTVGGLLLTKGFLVKVYKKWPIDVMESIMYFNILGFATLMWYFIGTPKRQTAVVYTSVIINLLFLLMVIVFHVYKFTPLCSIVQRIKIFKVLAASLLTNKNNKATCTSNQSHIEHEPQERDVSTILENPEPEIHIN